MRKKDQPDKRSAFKTGLPRQKKRQRSYAVQEQDESRRWWMPCQNDGRPSCSAGTTVTSKCAVLSSKIGRSQLHCLYFVNK